MLLGNLSLTGNPITEKEGYREKVFEIFPELEILDGADREGNEIDSEEEEYGEEEISEGTRKRLEEQGFALAEDDEDDYDDENFDDEDIEGDIYGDEDGEDEEDDESDEPAAKRQKK